MDAIGSQCSETLNPSNRETMKKLEKPKVVVIMGPTGSGKSRLAIDLALHLPIEIINADSMQVYRGLDVLTNKVPPEEQMGVPHHLIGTVSPNLDFTSKMFRDSAIPIINDIISRNCLPVIVGGTNYYIQALVSPFLLDESSLDLDERCLSDSPGAEQPYDEPQLLKDGLFNSYEKLKEVDPIAANRIHPNDHRKINQYRHLYARSGVLPSEIYQKKALENWGQVTDCRFNCCFICVDVSLPVLDRFVDQRVDCMIDAGLLNEVYDIYNVNADYTRGLRQAIGVREFENFFRLYLFQSRNETADDSLDCSLFTISENFSEEMLKDNLREILNTCDNNQHKTLLQEAIDKMKLNTQRLVRRQKRRLNRLQTLFGWKIHYVDATDSISCKSNELWAAQVVQPAVQIIRSFLGEDASSSPALKDQNETTMKLAQRDLWTQYICEACGDKVLRGAHEWEQHKQGRGHRKRISKLKKSQGLHLENQLRHSGQSLT